MFQTLYGQMLKSTVHVRVTLSTQKNMINIYTTAVVSFFPINFHFENADLYNNILTAAL